ncbi:hypothetical protein EYF80_003755 [Liparis tanakae]|uniref:Uncharacterized protein n=1 Tax=Liparis tanakae TaxID=230148 RepID=A0A4Z2J7I5_9TELE|nr:hypothetical protein EYF80_003755 [Liparis tanakae]
MLLELRLPGDTSSASNTHTNRIEDAAVDFFYLADLLLTAFLSARCLPSQGDGTIWGMETVTCSPNSTPTSCSAFHQQRAAEGRFASPIAARVLMNSSFLTRRRSSLRLRASLVLRRSRRRRIRMRRIQHNFSGIRALAVPFLLPGRRENQTFFLPQRRTLAASLFWSLSIMRDTRDPGYTPQVNRHPRLLSGVSNALPQRVIVLSRRVRSETAASRTANG